MELPRCTLAPCSASFYERSCPKTVRHVMVELTSGRVGSMAGLEAAAAPVASLRSATGLPSIEAGIGWSGTRFDRQRRPWISPLVRVRVSGYGALRGRPEPVTGRWRLACDRFGRLQREA